MQLPWLFLLRREFCCVGRVSYKNKSNQLKPKDTHIKTDGNPYNHNNRRLLQ
jgi:hypothetical protein